MTMRDFATLEKQIETDLLALLPDLELEPVKGKDTAALQDDGATTSRLPLPAGAIVWNGAGILAIHFYAPHPSEVLGKAYSTELEIEAALNVSESPLFTIAGCQFETRIPLMTKTPANLSNVECTYNIQYTIRR